MAKKPGAHNSRAHQQRAQSAYDEILQQEGEPAADLKSLIAGIKAATAKKTQSQKRISKKQVVQAKQQLTKEQRILDLKEKALDEEFKREQARTKVEEQRAQDDLSNTQLAVRNDPQRDRHYDLGVDFTRLYTELLEVLDNKEAQLAILTPLDLPALEAMWRELNMLAKQITQLSSTLFSQETVQAEEDKFKLLLQKVQPRLRRIQESVAANRRLLGNDKSKVPTIVRPVRPASNYVPKGALAPQSVSDANLVKASKSTSLMRLMGMFGRGLVNAGVAGGNALWSGGQVVGNRMNTLALRSVSVVAKTGAAIWRLGDKIKDVKDTGTEWMKKVGDLFSYVRRKWTSLKSGAKEGAGMLGTLIGLGMLFDSLIKPIFQGLNDELEKRFGPNYVRDFINGMWDKSKTWLLDGIKKLFFGAGEKDDSGPGGQTRKDMRGGLTVINEPQKAFLTPTWGAKQSPDAQERLLSTSLRSYKFSKDSGSKDEAEYRRRQIEFFLNRGNGITLQALPAPLYDDLKGSGFNVSKFTRGAAPAAADKGPTFTRPMVSMGGIRGGIVMGSAPFQMPSQPVTAPVPARQAQPSGTAAKSVGKAGVAPGMGNASISKQGVSDLFEALNSGVLGGMVP